MHPTQKPGTTPTPPPVKPALTRKRRRSVVENDDYAKFARRVIRAYARRVATGDVEALASMTTLAADLENEIRTAVIGLREPAVSSCPACGHRFTDTDTGDCPTNQIVRPLLRRRRHEQTGCLKPLTDIQHIDLIDTKPTVRKPARTPKPDVTLFALVLAFVIGAIAYRTHSNLAAFSTLAFTATAAITTWRNPT